MTPAEQLAEQIRAGHARWLESQRRVPQPAPSNRASEMGHPCLRYLVLVRLHPKPETSDALQGTFAEGVMHEEHVKSVLSWMGLKPYGSERSFPQNAYQLTGHVDLALRHLIPADVSEGYGVEYAETGVEVKSLTHPHWERIDENDGGESIKNHTASYVRRWYTQDQLYAFLADHTEWLFLVKSKVTGQWKVIVTPLDLDHVERCLDRATAVNKHVADGTLPDYHNDPGICRRCPFYGGVCQPGLDYGPGAIVVASEEWAELWDEVIQEREDRLRLNENYDRVKEWAKTVAQGEDRHIICGNALVHVRFRNGKMLPLRVEKL